MATATATRAKDDEATKKAAAEEKERLAKQKEKEKAAKAKEKEKAAKAKEKEKAAKAKEKEAAAPARSRGAGTRPSGRKDATRPRRDGSPAPEVHEKGWIAEQLGRQSAVDRSTKRPTLAASFTTRDHDVIRTWAESRGGVPADVRGTGDGESSPGVLRIEFRDEADRLEDVSWDAFFATFDDSDVDFLYQEYTKDGSESRFFKIVRNDG